MFLDGTGEREQGAFIDIGGWMVLQPVSRLIVYNLID